MSSDVRITMIGFKGSGKTSYLVGMYHQMLVGFRGFTMLASEAEAGREIEKMWASVENGSGESRWPQLNVTFEDYQFELNYGNAPFLTVDWVDYAGGVIDKTIASTDVQELMKRLTQSTCVFIAVSGEYLTQDPTLRVAVEKMLVPRINELMTQLQKLHPTHEKPLPVAIVITKYDYCIASGRTKEQIIQVVKTLFSSLFVHRPRLFLRAPSYLTAICTATLGEELAGHEKDGKVNPHYLQLPIFFAAWATLRQRLADATSNEPASAQDDELKGMLALLAERIAAVPIYLEGEEYPKTEEQK